MKKLIIVTSTSSEIDLPAVVYVNALAYKLKDVENLEVLNFTTESKDEILKQVKSAAQNTTTSLVVWGGKNASHLKSDNEQILAINGYALYSSILGSVQNDHRHLRGMVDALELNETNEMLATSMFEGAIIKIFENMK